jgi:hypothetical protein
LKSREIRSTSVRGSFAGANSPPHGEMVTSGWPA